MSTDENFLRSLRETFAVEAAEHLRSIEELLLGLESQNPPGSIAEMVDQIFRAAHTLKGAARSADQQEIEQDCHTLEDLFTSWKHSGGAPSSAELDQAFALLDAIRAVLDQGSEDGSGTEVTRSPSRSMENAESRHTSVRVAVRKLDQQLGHAEELLALKLTAASQTGTLREVASILREFQRRWRRISTEVAKTIPRESKGEESGLRLKELLDSQADQLKLLDARVASLVHSSRRDARTVARQVTAISDNAKKLLLLPFSTLSRTFSKMVRDLCRDLEKEVELIVQGEDVEIDRRILDEMKDPIVHLIRNCIDHGIEPPSERRAVGKDSKGTINLKALQLEAGKVELLISDDGAGIDIAKIRESAVREELLSQKEIELLSDREVLPLIFQSGISAREHITAVSGRGLGMAIVLERAEKVGGSLTVESERGSGTTFRILLPTSLSTLRGVLVRTDDRKFVIPTTLVLRVLRIRRADVKSVKSREVIAYDGRMVSLVALSAALGFKEGTEVGREANHLTVVVVGLGEQRVALSVDEVLEEQELLVKPLRKPFLRVPYVSGATILGSGELVPILRTADLIASARSLKGESVSIGEAREAPQKRRVLVVEDSITTRMLFKSILETAGYEVETASDGVEALSLLRTEHFDLVVSDVEMPRLGGFELTAQLRAEEKFVELPVVLVTALENRENRERGIEVGANAYIVKNGFEEQSLLETVRRLL